MSDNNINAAAFDAINTANQNSTSAARRGAAGSSSAVDDAQNRFLKLLTAQLNNQDPFNPLDNAQMTSQLAQISTVDGITKLNTTMQSMLSSFSDGQTFQAASMVGRTVLVEGNQLKLADGKSAGGFSLESAADNVTATIKDANGLVVRTVELGSKGVGTSAFSWDGATDKGEVAANGAYTVSFAARQGADKVAATALEYGPVTSVTRTGKGVTLSVGEQNAVVNMSEVKQIL